MREEKKNCVRFFKKKLENEKKKLREKKNLREKRTKKKN
jgi:hypothetical protein